MIILPERNILYGRILLPMRRSEWLAPSQRSTVFGIENQTRFSITARLNDGFVVWKGWFDDREDFDAFLYAMISGSLRYERELWRLPSPMWSPDLGEEVGYQIAVTTFLTASPGTNQTYTVPTDWNNGHNSIEAIGGGACGGTASGGGGGGAYAKILNQALTSGAGVTYSVGSGSASNSGVSGLPSWFGGSSLATSFVGAAAGNTSGLGSGAAGIGGTAANSVGTTKFSGGNGGNIGSLPVGGGGGGGAAGPSGAGWNGGAQFGVPGGGGGGGGGGGLGSNGGPGTAANGGPGGNGPLGTGGGTPGNNATAGTGGGAGGGSYSSIGVGGSGSDWDATHGAGGGGGGGADNNFVGQVGGLYGSGGGGGGYYNSASPGPVAAGGAGQQGIIVPIYTPVIAARGFNMAMMGF